jgi:hypothetical protein
LLKCATQGCCYEIPLLVTTKKAPFIYGAF